MSFVAAATFKAFSFDTTTPTTFPNLSISGPPLLPGCTGADICSKRVSSAIPLTAVTVPIVKFVVSPWGGDETA